jgi:hypothetical protein
MPCWPGRQTRFAQDCIPVWMNDECGQHISEPTKRDPLQEIRDLAVAKYDGAERDNDTEENDVVMLIQATEHFRGVRHSREIGADCDCIGNQQSQRDRRHEWSWKFFAERAGQAAASHQTDTRGHHLDGGHERPGDERGPQNRSAELRPHDRISADGGRVIISRTADQPRSQHSEESPEAIPHWPVSVSLRHGQIYSLGRSVAAARKKR